MYGLRITYKNAIEKEVADEKYYPGWKLDKVLKKIRGFSSKDLYELRTRRRLETEFAGKQVLIEVVEKDDDVK